MRELDLTGEPRSPGGIEQISCVPYTLDRPIRELDLTAEQRVPGGLSEIPSQPYSPSRHREWSRFWIALSLVILLFGVMGFLATSYLPFKKPIGEIQTMAEILLTPLIGLVGIVFGFYFAVIAGSER